jgi:hypothetical protein
MIRKLPLILLALLVSAFTGRADDPYKGTLINIPDPEYFWGRFQHQTSLDMNIIYASNNVITDHLAQAMERRCEAATQISVPLPPKTPYDYNLSYKAWYLMGYKLGYQSILAKWGFKIPDKNDEAKISNGKAMQQGMKSGMKDAIRVEENQKNVKGGEKINGPLSLTNPPLQIGRTLAASSVSALW